jgi:hypothetical protein
LGRDVDEVGTIRVTHFQGTCMVSRGEWTGSQG